MTFRFRFVLRSLLVVLVALMVAPNVRADGWNKETVVTFSHPVEVPGKVLPAGTYVFKLLSNEADRRVVQIFSEDQAKLLATVMAIPDYRLVATEKPVISFEERPSGSPDAVGSWFYPGDNHGVRFVYPNLRMALADNSQPAATPAPPPAEATTTPAPPAVEAITTPIDASVQQEQERQIVARERPVQPMERVPSSLPKTASNFMALPLAGFGLLFAGATLLRNAHKPN
jgi:Protein of unknown function (DUF2911)